MNKLVAVFSAFLWMAAASFAQQTTLYDRISLNQNGIIAQPYVAGTSISQGQLVKLSGLSSTVGGVTYQQVILVQVGATAGILGVAVQTVTNGQVVSIALMGQTQVLSDNACASGNFLTISSTTNGDALCNSTPLNQSIGQAFQTITGPGLVSAAINLGGGNASSGGGGGPAPAKINSFLAASCNPISGQDYALFGCPNGPQIGMASNPGPFGIAFCPTSTPCTAPAGTVIAANQATVYVATSCAGLGANCVQAVADDSTDNATAFTSIASQANAYVRVNANDIPTVLFAAGTFRYSSGLNFTKPVKIQCENGGTLDYSGSAHAMDWGPTTLTGSTYQQNYFAIGCTFTGGGSMTEGLYVNDGVLYPHIWDSRFVNFGNSTPTVWQVYFNGPSVGIDDPEVARSYFFINDNTGRNGVKVNSGSNSNNQLRFTDNVMLCAQVPGTTNMNGTHVCSGGNTSAVGVYIDGLGSIVQGNNIAWFPGGDVQLGSNSYGSILANNTMETNAASSSVSTPAIVAGPASGAAPASISVSNLNVNVHNGDFSTTSSAIGMGNASAVMVGWLIQDLTVEQLGGSNSVVALNNVNGNIGNAYTNVSDNTGTPIQAVFNSGSSIGPFTGLSAQGSLTGESTYGFTCTATSLAPTCYSGLHGNSTASGALSRFILDTAGDSETWPNRGGFLQHTSGASGGTRIGDWEGLPVQVLTSPTPGNIGFHTTFLPQGGIEDAGTTFSASGCSISAHTGGAAMGQYTSGTNGTCTVTITPGSTAAHGWTCWANDLTTPADVQHQTSASSATVAVISGTTASGDVVNFGCHAY